jgi:hypothetical protein
MVKPSHSKFIMLLVTILMKRQANLSFLATEEVTKEDIDHMKAGVEIIRSML